MVKKNETKTWDLKTYFMILLGLLAIALLILWWFFPRKVVEIKTVTKTVYVQASATITGGTTASISPQGVITVAGQNLSIVASTTLNSTETEKDVTKYETAQWFVMAYYGTDNRLGVGALKRIVGPFYAGIGIDTELPILPVLDRFRGRVYLGATF